MLNTLVDTLKNNGSTYIRARWNQDGLQWDNADKERHETYHIRQGGNVILHMYREWTNDGPYWSPDGGKMYSRDYDFGAKNMDVKDVIIPDNVHAEILEVARTIPEELVDESDTE